MTSEFIFQEDDDLDDNIQITSGSNNNTISGGITTESIGNDAIFVNDLMNDAPEHACKYCGLSDPLAVVKCIESGFWFCNSSGDTSASHIIHHLVRSSNREICLHHQSPLGPVIIECYNCATKNIFTIGFTMVRGERTVVLLCRSCQGISALEELGWNLEEWVPLVQDRQLISWLVKVPTKSEQDMAPRQVNTAIISKMEEIWKKHPDADGNTFDVPDVEEPVDPVELRYIDGLHYQKIMEALVNLEADYDKELKSQMREDNVNVRWQVSEHSGKKMATLLFSAAISETMHIAVGDELLLTLSKFHMNDLCISLDVLSSKSDGRKKKQARHDWHSYGTVIKIEDGGEVCLLLQNHDDVPLHIETGYSVSYVWRDVTFVRMKNALKEFATNDQCISGYLYHKLLGHDVDEQVLAVDLPKRINVPGLPELNESQIQAISQVLRKPLALIQGPPGTGKTVTSATLVYHMVRCNKNEQVLVTAPSNVAVDQLTERIHRTGLKVVRVCAKTRENLDSDIEPLYLHYMIVNLGTPESKELKKLLNKQTESGHHLSKSETKRLEKLRTMLERKVLMAAEVICCTCSGAGDSRLRDITFRRVLLDEATQATEPESLIPIVNGCKQFVLVGDHCQLGPVVMCKKAVNAGLNSSMFEHLVTLGLRPIRLQVQYRMHPCLSEFPSNTFYEGSLQNGVSAEERTVGHIDFPWPDLSKPMMFFSCMGYEELASTGTSYLNRTEASNCEQVVTTLLNGGVHPSQIGVVTPYEGQRSYIITHMQRHGKLKTQLYKGVEVSSVDAFQGREKDFIILSCVRSNEKQGIGFLSDPRRLNVALTRAKLGLIILGNPRVLSKQPLWNTLLVHFRDSSLLMEGTLNKLTVSMMRFSKTKKYYRDRRQLNLEEHTTRVFSGDVSDPFGENARKTTAPEIDSRFDARYEGCNNFETEMDFQRGPMIQMPKIPNVNSTRKQSGYGDVDYATSLQPVPMSQQSYVQGEGLHTQTSFASQSQYGMSQSSSQLDYGDD